MNEELGKIISGSNFSIMDGTYIYAKVAEVDAIDSHFMISKDRDEITVVTEEKNLAKLKVIERNKDNYCLIALNVSMPFYSIGFLAEISRAVADGGMNILIVSTYSKDYILIRIDQIENAISALKALGLKEE